MNEYTTITVPQDLLPQILGELLALTDDQNAVEVVHGAAGREIRAHPELAAFWFQARQQILDKTAEEAIPEKKPEEAAPLVPQSAPVVPAESPAPSAVPVTSDQSTTTPTASTSSAPRKKNPSA